VFWFTVVLCSQHGYSAFELFDELKIFLLDSRTVNFAWFEDFKSLCSPN